MRRIGSGRERGGIYYLDDSVSPISLVVDQPDPALIWKLASGASIIAEVSVSCSR